MELGRLYGYLFYRMYDWGRRVHGDGDLPEYNAIFGLSLLATMNLLSAVMLLEFVFDQQNAIRHPKAVALCSWALMVAAHYLLLLRRGHLSEIGKEIEREPASKLKSMSVWLYPLGSVLLFFGLFMVRL